MKSPLKLHRVPWVVALLSIAFSWGDLLAQGPPPLISYQGRIIVDRTNYNGQAYFKFALVQGAAGPTVWSNDGSTGPNAVATVPVPLQVNQGLYAVLLGDTSLPVGMTTPIPAAVFEQSDIRLQVRFSATADGIFEPLGEQRIASVGYALTAATVPDGSIGSAKLVTGAVGATQLAPGSVGATALAEDAASLTKVSGAVLTSTGGNIGIGTPTATEALEVVGTVKATAFQGDGSGLTGVPAATLGDGSVTTAKLADGAVTTPKLADASVSNTKLINNSITINPGHGLTGGGVVPLGDSVTLATTGTAANTPSTLIERDGNGDFAARTLTLDGRLELGATDAGGNGMITSQNAPLLHVFGSNNTFVGINAGTLTIGFGGENTGTGTGALGSLSGGEDNTAHGAFALAHLAGGTDNTAFGGQALVSLTNGIGNLAIGSFSGFRLTNGNNNIYLGSYGQVQESGIIRIGTSGNQSDTYLVGTVHAPVFEGSGAGLTDLQLPSGSITGTQLADGSVDNTKLAQSSITISPGHGLTGGGTASLGGTVSLDTTATPDNVPSTIVERNEKGDFAARSISITKQLQLPLTDAQGNGMITVEGFPFLHRFGYVNNLFLGFAAGNLTMSNSMDNIGIGAGALIGVTEGSANTVVGSLALRENPKSSFNTAIGSYSLYSLTNGTANTVIGFNAGSTLLEGYNNIYVSNDGEQFESNTIRIGRPDTHTSLYLAGVHNSTVAGGVPVYALPNGQLGTLTSSARFKRDIQDMGSVSDVLLSLRPVEFRYRESVDPNAITQFGLIAEEVNKVAPQLVLKDTTGAPYTVRYEAVNAMLLNEFQKEHRRVQDQASTIQELKGEVGELRSQVAELKALMMEMKAQSLGTTPQAQPTAATLNPSGL